MYLAQSRKRTRSIAFPRQVAMYLSGVKELRGLLQLYIWNSSFSDCFHNCRPFTLNIAEEKGGRTTMIEMQNYSPVSIAIGPRNEYCVLLMK